MPESLVAMSNPVLTHSLAIIQTNVRELPLRLQSPDEQHSAIGSSGDPVNAVGSTRDHVLASETNPSSA